MGDPHHPLSHHGNDPAKIERLSKINAFHVSLFAYYLERLKATPEGNPLAPSLEPLAPDKVRVRLSLASGSSTLRPLIAPPVPTPMRWLEVDRVRAAVSRALGES